MFCLHDLKEMGMHTWGVRNLWEDGGVEKEKMRSNQRQEEKIVGEGKERIGLNGAAG